MNDKYKIALKQKLSRIEYYYKRSGFLEVIIAIIRFIFFRSKRYIIKGCAYINKIINRFFYFTHQVIFYFLCVNAHLIRKLYKPHVMSNTKNIKVLHVTCSFDIGGTQRQIINLCENDNNENFRHEAIEIFPEYNYLYRRDIILSKDRYLSKNFFYNKLGEMALNKSSRSYQVIQIYKLIRDFEKIKPDIVVGWGHEIAMLSFIAASIARVPKIMFCIRTFNPSYGWTNLGALLKKAHKRMEPYLAGIIVNSNILSNDYSSWLGIPEHKIKVCYNGVSLTNINNVERSNWRKKICDKYKIPPDSIIINNIGRFSKEKGQLVLIKSIQSLIKRFSKKNIYLLLCGDGPLQDDIYNYIKINNINNIILAGQIDNIHSFLYASDIFIMPSNFEGMPNAMMEAMAYGLPCISTNRSGILDIARENHEALYVDPNSDQQLFDKISYLIEHCDERKKIADNAAQRIKEFGIDVMVNKFNKYLEKITEEANQ